MFLTSAIFKYLQYNADHGKAVCYLAYIQPGIFCVGGAVTFAPTVDHVRMRRIILCCRTSLKSQEGEERRRDTNTAQGWDGHDRQLSWNKRVVESKIASTRPLHCNAILLHMYHFEKYMFSTITHIGRQTAQLAGC